MRELLLFRHAKSSWDQPGVADRERDLAPRGLDAARRMGALLRERGLVPDLVLCSTARRTVHTWQLAAAALGAEPPVPLRRAALSRRTRADDRGRVRARRRRRSVCSWSATIRGCTGWPTASQPPATSSYASMLGAKFPTAGSALIALDLAAWSESTGRRGELRGFWRPRDLGVAGD